MPSPIYARIKERLDALGLSEREASLEATGSAGTIRNIRLGKSEDPRYSTLEKLAKVMKVTPQWLQTGDDNAQLIEGDGDVALIPGLDRPKLLTGAQSLPILGTAMGSIIHENFEGFRFDGAELGFTGRPPILANVPDAYALIVMGDSMYPMHPPGERRLVNPRWPTAPGNTVVVITKLWEDDPGQAYIKILRRRTQQSIVLEQLNPPATIEIPTRYVAGIHYVLSYDDLLGR